MKYVKINPSNLNGEIIIPPSKSISHRAIIAASLSNGESNIDNIIFSDDINATIEAMKSFGAIIKKSKNLNEYETSSLNIKGTHNIKLLSDKIDCRESGSTLRFLVPFAGLINNKVTFTGRGKLISRPLDVYYKLFDKQNIKYENNEGKLPLSVNGRLSPGIFEVKGNISSQFITGLLFTLPLLDGQSKIVVTTNLESKGYVDLTLDILKKFSINVENNEYKEFIINGNQSYKQMDYRIEGDFSQAAFWIVAGILGSKITCNGLDLNSNQCDKAILDIIDKMGANLTLNNESVMASESTIKGITIDVSQCPDLVPILAVLGALSKGTTKIINASRLRIKESDRLKAIASELNKLGADVEELEDGLVINGKSELRGGIVDSWNDHRIAMALAIASIKCKESVTITNSEAVKKSYPGFWDDFKMLGGIINERDIR